VGAINIRQAVIQDIPRIIPVFDSYREYFKQKSDPIATEQFLFNRFEHRESVLYLAELGDELVGFAHLYPSFSSLSLQRVWILNDFFISESFRNQGVGKRLIEKVKEFARLTKAKGIELSVEHTNINAWTFWEKRDFMLDKEFRYYFFKI
jgi:ribosomal protein S18 acetylase RimI-like enzyme